MKEHIKKSGRTVAENDIHIFFPLSNGAWKLT